MAGERVYYQQSNVKVTDAVFVVDNETYSLGLISSVKVSSRPSFRAGGVLIIPAALIVIPLIPLVSAFFFWNTSQNLNQTMTASWIGAVVTSLGLIVLGVLLITKLLPVYFVEIGTGGRRRRKLLKSRSPEIPMAVVAVLSQSLVDRG